MTEKLIESLAQTGALGIISWALIVYIGRKVDRLHDAIADLARRKTCHYDPRPEREE